MKRVLGRTAVLLLALCASGSRSAFARNGEWPTEQVVLVDGRSLRGLIESEDTAWVYLTEIQRPKGRPMFLVVRPINRNSIERLVRLEADSRKKLRQRIEQFKHRLRIEAAQMKSVRLGIAKIGDTPCHRYRGKWFTLDSSTDEPTARRVVVRVEQVFAAYRQILPSRTESAQPLRFVVLGSLDEYRAFLAEMGLKISNPAVYVRERNLVVAASETARYTAELEKTNARHEELRAELKELEKQLAVRLKELGQQLRNPAKPRGEASLLVRLRREAEEEIKSKKNEIRRCDRQNAQAFDKVTRRMFARLYHEAFHAYLENYVYPQRQYDVPLWLNEGLATVFEQGQLESGSLRVDAPNRPALKLLKADLNSREPLPLERLLAAGGRDFLVGEGKSSETSNRYYYHAWGLVYYLAFERRLLGSPRLSEYVSADARAVEPVKRFERLVDMPAPAFRKEWRKYIATLK